jgi:hypothetical protein
MRSNYARAALLVGAVAAAIVLFVVLNADGDEDKTSAVAPIQESTTAVDTGATAAEKPERKQRRAKKPPTIVVRGGSPVGGVKKLEFKSGERVRFAVRSDVGDEVHVHGYDRSSVVQAGGQVRFDFKANLEGVFEIELERRGVQIAELRVEPS